MEVKINKEIRDYSESVFFGLSIRQLVFSSLAIAVAVMLYFLLRGRLGTENLSWVLKALGSSGMHHLLGLMKMVMILMRRLTSSMRSLKRWIISSIVLIMTRQETQAMNVSMLYMTSN